MSRSGYSDDCENFELYRASVDRAMRGARGQHFLRKLRTALDAMPTKRLIADVIADEAGDVCALGSVDPAATVDPEDADAVGAYFGIARSMAAEIVYENDEGCYGIETPEERWARMRAWVEKQIGPDVADQPTQEQP